jgi:excisionase family DNA binding protein
VTEPPDLTRKELALALGVSLDTVYRLTHSRDIPFIRLGRAYRYNLAEVRQALRPEQRDSWAPPSRKKLRRA